MIKNQWYAILPAKAVKSNAILSVKRLGIELALFRTKNGQLGCVEDQCSHRGASLSHGKLNGDCISCPFHGLQFDAQGRCNFIPANGKSSLEDLSRYNVTAHPVKEAHELIYFWYGDSSLATDELPFFHDYIDTSFVFSEIEDSWNTHYSRSIENQLDVVHLPFVHYNTIGRGNRTLVNGPKYEYVNGMLKTSANNERDEGQIPRDASNCTIGDIFLGFLFPNVWMNHISKNMLIIGFFAPVDEENTVVYFRFYTNSSKFKLLNQVSAFFGKFGNKLIERQDKRVVTKQLPKASSLVSGEHLLKGDGPIILYRQIRDDLKNSNE